MSSGQLSMEMPGGSLCSTCPLRDNCGAAHTEHACRPRWGGRSYGGVNARHPQHPHTALLIDEVGGPGFDVQAQPTALPSLPLFVTQIRARRALRRQLTSGVYCVGLGEAIQRRRRMLTADGLRQIVGLSSGQPVVLQMFGTDRVLERLWTEREELLPQIAGAGFDAVISPSYSIWTPRPRPEHLISFKRSLRIFEVLQALDVPAVPRLGWVVDADVKRWARWAQANPVVETVALDLGTYRSAAGWNEQLEYLADFDQLTERRLRYWIHGPSVFTRYTALGSIVGSRMTLTNARAIAAPGTFAEQEQETHRVVALAAELADAERADQLVVTASSEATVTERQTTNPAPGPETDADHEASVAASMAELR